MLGWDPEEFGIGLPVENMSLKIRSREAVGEDPFGVAVVWGLYVRVLWSAIWSSIQRLAREL